MSKALEEGDRVQLKSDKTWVGSIDELYSTEKGVPGVSVVWDRTGCISDLELEQVEAENGQRA